VSVQGCIQVHAQDKHDKPECDKDMNEKKTCVSQRQQSLQLHVRKTDMHTLAYHSTSYSHVPETGLGVQHSVAYQTLCV